mmetsp:Transcript_8794/g.25091  ORF Transcript_8794/g.25091 Transcript_8794/m.25091 type:complete len:181 (-) Transcript_8794:1328-1870(-)
MVMVVEMPMGSRGTEEGPGGCVDDVDVDVDVGCEASLQGESESVRGYIGRKQQVRKLLWLLGSREDDECPPLLVHGPETTGKTMVVREVLGSIERPFAWTSARACATTKNIIASGLTQLREQGWLPEMGGKVRRREALRPRTVLGEGLVLTLLVLSCLALPFLVVACRGVGCSAMGQRTF